MKRSIYILTAVALVLAACTKENEKTTFANQEKWIEQYVRNVTSDGKVRVVHNKGSVRVVIAEGSGTDSTSSKSMISVLYAGYTMNSSNISTNNMFYTNNADVAKGANWVISDSTEVFRPDTLKLSNQSLVSGLRHGLEGVKPGEECMILFSGKHGFGDKTLGTISANSALAYHVWVKELLVK